METPNMEELEKKIEEFKETELLIHRPDKMGLHTWGIDFDCEDRKICMAYDLAITEIDKEKNLGCFHQSGRPGVAGYHFFEMFQLDDETAEQKIQELMPQIHALAKKKYETGFVSFD